MTGSRPQPPDPVAALRRAAATASASGHSWLSEPEALAVLTGLGIRVPRFMLWADTSTVEGIELGDLPGSTAVVKVMAPDLIHKSRAGGVAVVPKNSEAIRAAIAGMVRSFGPDAIDGFMVSEYLPHDAGPGAEILLGARWTDDFGPVVAVGPGGVYADQLTSGPSATLIVSAGGGDPAWRAKQISRWLAAATKGAPGGPPGEGVALALIGAVEALLALATAVMPQLTTDIEVNPLVFDKGGAVALDAVIGVGSEARRAPAPARPGAKLERLLHPRSIAVIGVSERMNPGRIIVRNVLAAGFPPDAVTIIKPGADQIEGCRCVPDLRSLDGSVDLLVVSVDAAAVPDLIEEVVAGQHAEAVILIPGGLGEMEGSEPAARRIEQILTASRSTSWQGPVVNGGNCLGVRSQPGRFDTFFIPGHKARISEASPAPLALVSQSGAFALSRLDRLSELAPRYTVSVGNQIDLTVGDYLSHFAERDDIEIAACYVEGFRLGDGARWADACRRMTERGGTVVLYKAARSPEGARSAVSHTAAAAGDYTVTVAMAEAAGALVASTIEEFEDLLTLAVLLRAKVVAGMRLGAVSNAGFEAVAMADHVGGLQLARLGHDTRIRLQEGFARLHLEGIVAPTNPLDVTPITDDRGFADAVAAVLDDPAVDVGVVGCVPFTPALETLAPGPAHREDLAHPGAVAERLITVQRRSRKAWVAVVDAGRSYDPLADELAAGGIPTFRSADRAVLAFARYCGHRRRNG